MSTDQTITTSDTYVGYRNIAALAADAAATSELTAAMPVIAGGQYYVGVVIDPNNTIAESDETNNSLAGTQIANTRL